MKILYSVSQNILRFCLLNLLKTVGNLIVNIDRDDKEILENSVGTMIP